MKLVPLLLTDFYKCVHAEQYPKGLNKIVSYFTPRMSRIEGDNALVMFGLQGFIKEYLIEYFNENFFNKPLGVVLGEYNRILNHTLGPVYDSEKISKLHRLGYLPIKIRAIDEGTLVPVKVPMIEISNTHDDFAWVVNALETLMSCELWHTMLAANVGYKYRQIVNKYYDLSVDGDIPKAKALGDFSLRGAESLESGIHASSAWLTSFLNTATVPAIAYLEEYYNCDCTKEPVGFGAVSTEHSVMCSNFAADGNERDMLKRLLTGIYPNASFSMVSDSYDYWNMVNVIIPSLKEEILAHNGCLLVRGDSGDPVQIVTKTVFELWETFGGTVNSKGYKVLDSHVKAIYGDSITPSRANEIYDILVTNGFACNNVSLGVGSFSFQCLEDSHGVMNPYTRDTFGIAVKATYGEINGVPHQIFKNPKTDTGHFKKSQKGCCVVKNTDGIINYIDEVSYDDSMSDKNNLLTEVFVDSKMVKEQSIAEIRNKLHGGSF